MTAGGSLTKYFENANSNQQASMTHKNPSHRSTSHDSSQAVRGSTKPGLQELRAHQEALEFGLRKYKDLFNLAPSGYFTVLEDGTVHDANVAGAELLCVDRSKLAGRHLTDFMTAPSRSIFERFEQAVLASEGNKEACDVELSSGRARHLHLEAISVQEAGDGRLCSIGATDVTAQFAAEAERLGTVEHVLQTQKLEAVGRLATGIARDFNNALGVILGTVELALENISRAQSPAADLRCIQETARRSAELTSNLLKLASRQPVARRAVNLNAAIERELSKLAQLAGPSIELVFRRQPGLHPVTIDSMQVHQLLSNLVENARDAMRAGGRIVIETREVDLDARKTAGTGVQPGRFVALCVQDDGEGMNEATRLRAFDPYFSARPGRRSAGLGLAIVHGILKQNEGFVQVESAPGAGATFTMYLPLSRS